MGNLHIIGKQVWELHIGSSENAYAIQQEVSDMIWKELSPELNTMFDTLVTQHEVITIDKIELDLSTITLSSDSRAQIINKIVQAIHDQCFRAKLILQNSSAFDPWEYEGSTHETIGQHQFESWIYWLKTGTLPSYTSVLDEQSILLVLETLGLEHRAVSLLQSTLANSSVARRRLILQHKTKDLKSIVELFTGYVQAKLPLFFKEVKKLLRQIPAKGIQHQVRETELALWELVFKKVIINREKLSSEKLTSDLVCHPYLWAFKELFQGKDKTFAQRYPLLLQAYGQAQASIIDTTDQASKKREPLQEESEPTHTPENHETLEVASELTYEPQKYEVSKEQDHIPLYSEEKKPGPKTTNPSPEHDFPMEELDVSSPQFFNNAGLVLLHPFLKHLFVKLKLVKAGAFTTFKKKSKAVLLLQYLSTGKEVFGDYEMVLPKYLCDMPVNLPMDHTLRLSKKEKGEAHDLLKAVIDHWGALGSTSPDGLREGFLMREGKLLKEESGWKLYVAQNAMDVLLDRIPWNLSMIKLPWMKDLLYVEWR